MSAAIQIRRAARMAPEDRRAKLMKSVIRVFAEHGIGEARHAQVAEEAGVSLSTVFVYFPTREALVDAALDETRRFFFDLAEELLNQDLPVITLFTTYGRKFAELADTDPDYIRIFLNWSGAVGLPYWKKYVETHEFVVSTYADIIDRGKRDKVIPRSVDSENAAEIFVGAAHIIAQMKFMGKEPNVINGFIASVVRTILVTGTI